MKSSEARECCEPSQHISAARRRQWQNWRHRRLGMLPVNAAAESIEGPERAKVRHDINNGLR